jgi:hypothetical protein
MDHDYLTGCWLRGRQFGRIQEVARLPRNACFDKGTNLGFRVVLASWPGGGDRRGWAGSKWCGHRRIGGYRAAPQAPRYALRGRGESACRSTEGLGPFAAPHRDCAGAARAHGARKRSKIASHQQTCVRSSIRAGFVTTGHYGRPEISARLRRSETRLAFLVTPPFDGSFFDRASLARDPPEPFLGPPSLGASIAGHRPGLMG